jgi:phytoene dehydrogenase-like protein
MSDAIDVVVIGGGHNGLTCAAYLARAGRQVLVIEAADSVGGAAVTREFAPGFSVSACAHLSHQLNPLVNDDLGLARHGLQWAARHLDTIALSPTGAHVRFSHDGARASGSDLSAADTQALVAFDTRMKRFASLLLPVFDQRPPRLAGSDLRDKLALAKLGLNIRRLGRDDMREFLRIAAINIYDVLEETFDHPLLKAAIGVDAVMGTHMGPRSPNSVLSYLYRLAGLSHSRGTGVALPRGGMGALTRSIASAAEGFGVKIRTGTAVRRILLEHDRVAGVELDGGEVIRATTVISNADPKTTFFKLLGADQLEAGFARYVRNIRMRGCAAKLHLALERLPVFNGLDAGAAGQRLLIAPTLDYVELAFNHAKYGEHSIAPVMEVTIPTIHDAGLAPAGKHVLSAVVQYAPHGLRVGWENAHAGFRELLIDTLAAYAPNIRSCISSAQLLTPVDIEQQFRIGGGHWHHGELALDQFLMVRPVPGAAQYQTPLTGLYLCGAGAHPGGGVMGSVGRNAAQAVLNGASRP